MKREDLYLQSRKALLIMDVQESGGGRTRQPRGPVTRGDVMIATINRLIDHCAAKGMEVAYIRQVFGNNFIVRLHGGRILPGTMGPRLDSRLKVINGHDFPKNRTDAFSNRSLDRFLIEHQVNELYLVGVDAAYCVYYTARGALNRGYKVIVVKDAVLTSRNLDEVLERYEKNGIPVMTSEEIIIRSQL